MVTEIRKRTIVWTVIVKESGLVDDEGTNMSGGSNDDVIATQVWTKGEKITRIVNIYHQYDSQLGERKRPE